MEAARVGDRVSVESEHVGKSARKGLILEVLGAGEGVHYRIRWDDGHESTLYQSGGSITITPRVKKTGSRR